MPEGAKCDFDSAQIHDGETCGWKIPQHHSNHMSENPQYISNMKGNKVRIISIIPESTVETLNRRKNFQIR